MRGLLILLILALAAGSIAQEVRPAPTFSKAINSAFLRYKQRGGKYQLGPNDCSVFVTDYMKARGKSIKRRWTTAEIWKQNLMQGIKMIPAQYATAPEQVFCIRYQNKENKWVGHTGIVRQMGESWEFVHNSEAAQGVVVEGQFAFEVRFLGVGVSLDQFRFYNP